MEKEMNNNDSPGLHEERILQLEKLLNHKTIQLEAATRELDDITFSISHDLKAPIRAIAGFAAILKEEQCNKLDDEGKRVIGVIEKNVSKLTGIINDVINYSSLSKKNLNWQKINMKALATEAVNVIMTPEEKCTFTITIDDLKNCNGDERMITQLWLNLVNIAILYAEKNAWFKLSIGCNEDDNAFTYNINVSPSSLERNETGTSKNLQANIVNHEQLESNGAGAAFIKRVLFKHGGNFWIQSLPSIDCVFYFSIPKQYF